MSPEGRVTLETIAAPSVFGKLGEEWNELLKASASDGLFLTWEWLHTWWKHLSGRRKLHLVAARAGDQIVGIAPLALRPPRPGRLLPFRALEFLGAGNVGSDYLDLILRRGREEEALRALEECLGSERFALELSQVRKDGSFAERLASRLGRRGWSLSGARANTCPWIRLSGCTWPGYLATLSRAQRYNFRRRLKNLTARFDLRLERIVSEDRRREGLKLLVDLHHRRWRGRGGSDAFHTPGLLAFHEEMSRLALLRGWLRLFILWLDGSPAASLYGFRYGPTFYFYQSGFDPVHARRSVGLVLMGLAIQSAIEEGAEEFDLLHGGEGYKFHWADRERELGRLELYPPGVRGNLCRQVVGWRRALRRMAQEILSSNPAGKAAEVGDIGV